MYYIPNTKLFCISCNSEVPHPQVLYGVLKERYIMPRRLLMTGTPIQNNLTELWALMHFCMPSVFGTLEQFLQTFKAVGDASAGILSSHYFVSLLVNTSTWECRTVFYFFNSLLLLLFLPSFYECIFPPFCVDNV